MINWEKILPVVGKEVVLFANNGLSGEKLYEVAVSRGVGPSVRPVIRQGVKSGRRAAREALRRRNML